MGLKRFGATFVASLALAAVFASSAFATATTTNSNWFVVGKTPQPLPSGETAAAKCSAAENFALKGTIAGVEVELKATGLECVSGAVIKQEGEHAIGTGQLKFTGVSVVKPATCKTPASITTNALTAKTYMEGTTVYTRFEPTTGETLATVELTECTAKGSYPVKGTLFGRASSATETEATNQPLTFSSTIQSTAGGSLTLAGKAANVSGKSNNELVSGSAFGLYETATVSTPVGDLYETEEEVTELEIPPGTETTFTIRNPNSFWNIYLEDFSIDGAGLEYTKPQFAGDCEETTTILRPGKTCTVHVKNNSGSTASGTLTIKWSAYLLRSGTLSIPLK
jgi:hypothetical protein